MKLAEEVERARSEWGTCTTGGKAAEGEGERGGRREGWKWGEERVESEEWEVTSRASPLGRSCPCP